MEFDEEFRYIYEILNNLINILGSFNIKLINDL
jgi:hypothetical protein